METSQTNQAASNQKNCHYCEGKGYIEIRDCSGEIQRSENCSYCEGTGYQENSNQPLKDATRPKKKMRNWVSST